jgi:uracil-DNA glycosylase family 4
MTAPTSSASSASDWSLVAHGPTNARLVYICEAPAHAASAEGELLSKMTVAMGLDPAQVLVIEIAGGDPESSVLTPLEKLLVPALASAAHVVAFGNLPARAALRTQDPMSNLRGRAHASPLLAGGARLWATYAPSLCIRNANMKKPVWEDLQQLMKELS